ncbi:MAG: hypothetical protein KDB14_02220 [Planctomycetales bacterium]|nr:hypothetical protein [Planctomycetales bacterium]
MSNHPKLRRVGVCTMDQVNGAIATMKLLRSGHVPVLIQTLRDLERHRLDALVIDHHGLLIHGDPLKGQDRLPCPVTALASYSDLTLASSWQSEGASVHRTIDAAVEAVVDQLVQATRAEAACAPLLFEPASSDAV